METSSLIFISFVYEFMTKKSNFLEITGIIITLFSLLFVNFYFWESPKFFFNKNRFTESRESLMKIARFNGLPFKFNLFSNLIFYRNLIMIY